MQQGGNGNISTIHLLRHRCNRSGMLNKDNTAWQFIYGGKTDETK